MIEKNSQKATIRKGLGPRRNPVSYQTVYDITIPAGTIMRAIGDDKFACAIGLGVVMQTGAGELSVTIPPGTPTPPALKRVISA